MPSRIYLSLAVAVGLAAPAVFAAEPETRTPVLSSSLRDRLDSLALKLPPIGEQKAIAAILNSQDQEIDLHTHKLDALRRQKQGLMQQLLTGKVRVKVTESSGE